MNTAALPHFENIDNRVGRTVYFDPMSITSEMTGRRPRWRAVSIGRPTSYPTRCKSNRILRRIRRRLFQGVDFMNHGRDDGRVVLLHRLDLCNPVRQILVRRDDLAQFLKARTIALFICTATHYSILQIGNCARKLESRTHGMLEVPMFLKILGHPVFVNLNFHMPMTVDLSHPVVMLTGENGSGKSTLLHSIYYALRGENVEGYAYRLNAGEVKIGKVFLFDAEQHNPRMQMDLFNDQPEMQEFLRMASHGQVMLSMFNQTFPSFPDGTILLLDEPEMALSVSNQRRILKMLLELADEKSFRIICATHSPVLIEAKETYVINLDRHINRNVIDPTMGVEGQSTIN